MKTAQLILALCLIIFPVSVRAVEPDFVSPVWNYPTRVSNQIHAWVAQFQGKDQKVLGDAIYINSISTPVDLTGQTVIEDQQAAIPNLQTKLDATGSALDDLYLQYQKISGEAVLMGLKWDNLTVSDVLQSLDRMNNTLGESSKLTWMIQSWGWPQLDVILAKQNKIKTDLATIRTAVSTSGMQPAAYSQLKSVAQDMDQVAAIIGDKTDKAEKNSLYGKYAQVTGSASGWDGLLGQLQQMQLTGNFASLETVGPAVLKSNLLPNLSSALSVVPKNRCLELIALVTANKNLLAADHGSTIATTWIEDSPMQFKTLLSNSSPLSRQQIAVKYFLPSELAEKDILDKDPNLEVKFDSDKKRLFVSGLVTVAAGDTRIVGIKTQDLWQFDATAMTNIQSQISSYVNSQANTSRFTQLVALKGQTDGVVTKITDLQAKNTTPLERIQAFRQIQVQMTQLNNDYVQVQTIASKSSPINVWKMITFWPQLVMASGGLGFAMMGITIVRKTRKNHFKWTAKKTVTPQNFSVFSTGIASSDL